MMVSLIEMHYVLKAMLVMIEDSKCLFKSILIFLLNFTKILTIYSLTPPVAREFYKLPKLLANYELDESDSLLIATYLDSRHR